MTRKSRVLDRYLRGDTGVTPQTKVAAPVPPPMESPKRDIPKGHPFDPRALKPLARSLFSASVALGHCLTAYRHLSRVKSVSVSPDGLLGGTGYVMNVKDMRSKLHEACEVLSNITDTLHDEINAPHWKPQLSQLDDNSAEDVIHLVEQAEEVMEDPEAPAEKELQEIEEANDGPDGTPKEAPGGDASGLPSESSGDLPENLEDTLEDRKLEAAVRVLRPTASSIPGIGCDDTPRVDSREPAGGDGPFGSFNEPEPVESDYWAETEGVRPRSDTDYPGSFEASVRHSFRGPVISVSNVPDHVTENTPTEGIDLGMGYGAKNQGPDSYTNPGSDPGVLVDGPRAELPSTPRTAVDESTPSVDVRLNERSGSTALPGDTEEPVARTDYYPNDKGNLVNVAQSQTPSEPAPFAEDCGSSDVLDTFEVTEDVGTPYVRYDYTTTQHRPDPLHNWPEKDS